MGGEAPTTDGPDEDVASIDRAMAALEAQRGVLGDAVVDTALRPLSERRAALLARETAEQRKLVTVLFADVVDFTVLSRQLDPEDTREVMAGYFTRWQEAIATNGGTVEKFIGDAVMAVFGLHQSWEDDAERAVRAALELVHGLDALNADLSERFGVELEVRIGIDTGEVVVSTLAERSGHEFVAVGPTVNRASRLQAAAPVGGILISAETHRQVRGTFSVEPRPGLRLKGLDDLVDAYVVLSERPQAFRLDRSGGVEGVETTTVGRDVEMRFLQERLLDVVEEQRWRVVTIFGDAGVGKSRLLLDFDTWLGERPEQVWWFRGRASHAGKNRANALLHDVMRSRLQIQESDPPDLVLGKFVEGWRKAFEGSESHEAQARLVAAWLGFGIEDDPAALPPGQSLRDQATVALAEYFARLSRTAPVVVLLEDLHWADDGSLRWLDAADGVLRDCPVLVVATSRSSLLERRPQWGEGLAHHVRLTLPPLSGRESRSLLGQLLQRVDRPPASLVDLVIEAAEGNPFYIEELVTWLVDSSVIVKAEPSWYVVDELIHSVIVPSTLRGVLQARLDALTPPERGVLQRASVVGRVFWDDAVMRLESSSAAPETSERLAALRRREIVFERELSTFDSSREFLFKHALLRDVAYEGVLRSHRERYHRLAAVWLAEVSARNGREQEYAALIADHFDRARAPEAATWFLRAGRQAAGVFALEEATRLLERGLQVVGQADPHLRFDLLAEHEKVMDRVGDRAAQSADVEEMGPLAAATDDGRRLTVLLARCRLAFEHSEYGDAQRWADQAADLAETAKLRTGLVEALLWRGKAQTWGSELEAARGSLQGALDLAEELGLVGQMAETLRYLAMVANNAGDYPTALSLIARSREAFRREGDTEAENVAVAMYASTCFNMGRLEESRASFEQMLPVFRRSGHRYREAVTLGNLAEIARSQGQLAQARQWCLQAAEIARQLKDLEATATNLLVLGTVATEVTMWEDAQRYLDEALETARSTGSAGLVAGVLTRMAVLALDEGEADRALSLAEEANDAAERAPSPLEHGAAALALGLARLATSHDHLAVQAISEAREAYGSVGREAFVRECDAALAVAVLRQGDTARAVGLVRPMLGNVSAKGLEDCLHPPLLLSHAWSVLQHAADPAAEGLLEDIHSFLLARAAVIGDEEMAAGYLARPVAAEILRAAGVSRPA